MGITDESSIEVDIINIQEENQQRIDASAESMQDIHNRSSTPPVHPSSGTSEEEPNSSSSQPLSNVTERHE